MKKNFMKIVLVALMAVLSSNAFAYKFVAKGFYFNVVSEKDLKAELTYMDAHKNGYTGDIVIPSTVEWNGKTYTVEVIGEEAFHGCSGITSITIPETVKEIADDAFYLCTGLTSITIPEGVESIGDYAFYRCTALKSVTIAASVESIGDFVFSHCFVLKDITCLATTPQEVTADTFEDFKPGLVTLHVPAGCKQKYAASGWKRVKEIVE